jgi:hypothetical protein
MVPGHVQENNKKATLSVTIHVTPDQAKAMRTYIQQAQHRTQGYDPSSRNCASFVEEVLRAGGVKAPSDITPKGLVMDLQKQNPQ